MDDQDKYDELDNIVITLDELIDEISDKEYIELLREIKHQAENELTEVEERLKEIREKEYKEMEREYERSVL